MDNNRPSCLENRVSLKALTIIGVDGLRTIQKTDDIPDYQLLLVTPYGIICGDTEEIKSLEALCSKLEGGGSTAIDVSIGLEFKNNYLKELEAEGKKPEPIDNGGAINLKNVTLYRHDLTNPILKINTMIVFADQVIAVSLISRNHV